MTMLHELRQFYDIDYRTFLVKAQLRTLAANELKLGPYISKMEASKAEAAWLFSLVDEDDSGLIDTDELKDMIEKTGQRVKDEEVRGGARRRAGMRRTPSMGLGYITKLLPLSPRFLT